MPSVASPASPASPISPGALSPLPAISSTASNGNTDASGKPITIGSSTPVASPLSSVPPPSTEGGSPVAAALPNATPTAPSAADITTPPGLSGPGTSSTLPSGPLPLPAVTTPASLAVPPPNLALGGPGLGGLSGPGLGGPGLGALTFPTIKVVREKEVKTWETRLAPTVKIPKTKFNYRRVVLSEKVYRGAYDYDNAHLPRRMTREEYANMLFNSIARNDVETTRTILNEGTAVHVTTAFGETPLQFARRAGATEVAQLLIARGASY